MTSHLHIHLEPEERKRSALGVRRPITRTSAWFLESHRLARPTRPAVTSADLATFLNDVHREQHADRVKYAELRISPRRFLVDGMDWTQLLMLTERIVADLVDPTIRLILLMNRDSPDDFIAECAERIEDGLPASYVGVDLAGDESAFPDVHPFTSLFQLAVEHGLGVTVHTGEFADDSANVWRAIDELGATRLAHALAVEGDRALLARLARDRIVVETSVSSNLALGLVDDLYQHPASRFVAHNVPVCFNTDVPVYTGVTLQREFALAAQMLHTDLETVLALQADAAQFAFGARGSNRRTDAGHLD